LENGNFEIGVHIADVSHFVKPDDVIDKDAKVRATSVYLVDRVIPMLPEHLSNGVCSLRPNEEKLCYSAVFEMTENAEVVNEWYGRTVINSNRRFTYEEAQEIIEGKSGDFENEIRVLNQLARKMRDERYKKGAIDFDKVEVKFNLDKDGKPLSVFFKVQKEANQLIEEFMLLANKKVAELIGKPKEGKSANIRPFVYRVHDKPNPEKLQSFSNFIKQFGYKVKFDNEKKVAENLNKLIKEVKGKGESNIIETLAIRSMAKAVYSTKNIGHYGLGFAFYTHFTSPIRRYPDVMVHRVLTQYLANEKPTTQDELEKQCKHSSEMEKKAADAERASVKYKQVEFLMDKLGEQYDGIISGVTEWGIFVEIIENKCEGMIRLRDMKDDYYYFDEETLSIIGRKYKRRYRLGDAVRIEIKKTDLLKKQLDFILID
jgi:ribonuclease R